MPCKTTLGFLGDVVHRYEGGRLGLPRRVVPVAGASVEIRDRRTGLYATLWQDPNGLTLANPLTTNSSGRFGAWVEPGDYEVLIEGAGLVPQTMKVTVDGKSLHEEAG